MSPRKIAPPTPEVPAAGVIATSPATAPDAPPSREDSPEPSRSAAIQPSPPAPGAPNELITAIAPPPVAPRLYPPLTPTNPRTANRMVGNAWWRTGGYRGAPAHEKTNPIPP